MEGEEGSSGAALSLQVGHLSRLNRKLLQILKTKLAASSLPYLGNMPNTISHELFELASDEKPSDLATQRGIILRMVSQLRETAGLLREM